MLIDMALWRAAHPLRRPRQISLFVQCALFPLTAWCAWLDAWGTLIDKDAAP